MAPRSLPALRAAAEHYRRNRFDAYDPLRSMVEFHKSANHRRLLRKPNQIGGSYAGAYEAWAHLVGRHLYRQIAPSSGRVVVASLESQYPVVCERLAATAPGDALDPATRYVLGKGYLTNGRRMIRTKAGHVMDFASGEGEIMAHASASLGWLWLDEIPKRSHFGEALSRVAVSRGPVWMTATPIGRPVGWFREHVEGNADTGESAAEEWVQFRPSLTVADCTTVSGRVIRTQESIDAQVAGYGAWERAQRVYGEWEGLVTERRFGGFNERCVFSDFAELPDDPTAVRIGADHGEGAGAQYLTLVEVSLPGPRFYQVAEWAGKGHETPREVAVALLRMLDRCGYTVHSLAARNQLASSGMYGDINSAGLLGGGGKFNDFLERAIAAVLGTAQCPFSIQIPAKGRGSVGAGEAAIGHAMSEGRWRVHESCKLAIESYRTYTGREEDLKHRVDGARYAVGDLLLQAPALGRTAIVV